MPNFGMGRAMYPNQPFYTQMSGAICSTDSYMANDNRFGNRGVVHMGSTGNYNPFAPSNPFASG